MSTSFLRPALAAIACAAAFSFVIPAFAEVVNLKATMTGKGEVPSNLSTGKGQVTATYDTATKKLSYQGTYSDLSGPATAAHFHGPATPGRNAGVAIPIFAGGAAKSPFEGSATLTDAQAEQLLAGQWYVNVHTAANKSGEIRGQLTK